MAANETAILAGVDATLKALYPTLDVLHRKFPSEASAKDAFTGWSSGDPNECFILSCNDPEPVDSLGSFEHISVRYRVRIEYRKPIVSGEIDDDDDLRQKRQDIRDNLFKPTLTGVSAVSDVRYEAGKPFIVGTGDKQGAAISVQTLTFLTFETRGHN